MPLKITDWIVERFCAKRRHASGRKASLRVRTTKRFSYRFGTSQEQQRNAGDRYGHKNAMSPTISSAAAIKLTVLFISKLTFSDSTHCGSVYSSLSFTSKDEVPCHFQLAGSEPPRRSQQRPAARQRSREALRGMSNLRTGLYV